ncbi:MAG: hypothetical protein LBT66_07080 [Methanobrevibacter sp.]|jgi:type I restriction enzyme S subunit|nr:hypothetical protein [Candidatus Methanovirga meridionalis]
MKLKQHQKYKDSGIEWIGKIPEDWEILPIKIYLDFLIGSTPLTSREDYFEGNNIWLFITDLNNTDEIYSIKN